MRKVARGQAWHLLPPATEFGSVPATVVAAMRQWEAARAPGRAVAGVRTVSNLLAWPFILQWGARLSQGLPRIGVVLS